MIQLTEEECRCVLDLLANAHTDLMHELHHTVTHKFQQALKQRLSLNEELARKLRESGEARDTVSQPAGARV